MKRWLAVMLIAASQAPLLAQGRIFRPAAVRAAAREESARVQFRDPRADWDRVRRISRSSTLVVYTRDGGLKCRFVSADASVLTVIDVETPTLPTRQIARAAVTEVSRVVSRKRPVGMAVAGAAAGFGLGLFTATLLAYKDCGGDCEDEGIFIAASLVGFPIVGGVLGYRFGGDKHGLEKIYVAP